MINFMTFLAFFAFAVRRLLSYLHFYQQEEYDPKRFSHWIFCQCNFDKRLSAVVILLSLLQIYAQIDFVSVVMIVVFIAFAALEKNPFKTAKKPLVLTSRAKRLLGLSIILLAALSGCLAFYADYAMLWLIPIHAIPLALIVATFLLRPYENRINKSLRLEAVKKLKDINPFIVAVTGSYGKTSVKHILGHILQNYAGTLITPGSVNTEMGIVRIIREQLTGQHKFFIVEMGAYGVGSIARLCALTLPRLSIITAIGEAHFERFKSLEETARAKFEIAESTLKQQGKIIVHENVLNSVYARNFYNSHNESIITCGANADIKIMRAEQTKEGLEIFLEWQGKEYRLLPPLYGLHHVDNVVLSFIAAVQLGMPAEDVIVSLQNLPQIKHRLEVKKLNDYILIDDAFNSNPLGFQNALDVLDLLGRDSGRRILVTPGMVELGEKHEEEHDLLGKLAAAKVDIALVVLPERIPSFVNAYKNHLQADKQQLIKVASFHEANEWIANNKKSGDVILLENDLPDLYEKRLNI